MRIARLNIPGVVHHLIWRFVDRGWFFTHDEERSAYLSRLGFALDQSDWRCLGYALMSNHVHLAVIAGEQPLATWSRRAHTPFARWMNEQHARLGPLFSDRAKDYALASARTAALLAYIHNNPVRAGVVAHAEDSRWTSHRAYLGLSVAPRWLHVAEGLRRSGFATGAELATFTRGESAVVDGAAVIEIAKSVKQRGAIVVATPDERVVPLVMRPFARIRPDPRHIVAIVCEMLALRADEVRSRRRSARLHEARRVIVHSGRQVGVTGADLAAVLGISEQAVSKIARHSQPPPLCERVVRRLADQLRIEGKFSPSLVADENSLS
jgi:REP element-mobilizing transposase RayT